MKIALIGNYLPDGQASMAHYATMLRDGFDAAGCDVRLVAPRAVLNRRRIAGTCGKWAGYVDKYLLGTRDLRRAARTADIVHICDHSNAVYVPHKPRVPHVVTCHDLLAVRGALGEETDCPASVAGQFLQRAILSGLGRAQLVVCVSRATLNDARRLIVRKTVRLEQVPNPLHYPYRPLAEAESRQRLAGVTALNGSRPFILHVGSNLRRKNRETVLEVFARVASVWPGLLVFAGHPLTEELRIRAESRGVLDRIVEVPRPTDSMLEALYARAFALLFPSRYEGFGWPVIEAQACGCPVLCGSRNPLPEVAGGAAILREPDDADGFAGALLHLHGNPADRAALVQRGLDNVSRYDRAMMIRVLLRLYQQVIESA